MNLTVEEILGGTGTGRMQSVGHMSVIPILDDGGADETFAPPDIGIDTSDYGTVNLRNRDSERPTIVPTGAGWVVDQVAQDHAIASAKLMKASGRVTDDAAMCIQQSQGGYIDDADHSMLILPASLRVKALSMRLKKGYDKLWSAISGFNDRLGIRSGRGGHLEYFMKEFEKEMDQFVAQFELVPNQVGAIVMIGDKVAGVERAPNVSFWERIWNPLIRVCYGSLAIEAGKRGLAPPTHRMIEPEVKSLAGIGRALADAQQRVEQLTQHVWDETVKGSLQVGAEADQKFSGYSLVTLANRQLSGQVVRGTEGVAYASLCAAG